MKAELFDGRALAFAWAVEAAAVAWLARRVRELRFQIWSAVYLLLTLGHVLILDRFQAHSQGSCLLRRDIPDVITLLVVGHGPATNCI